MFSHRNEREKTQFKKENSDLKNQLETLGKNKVVLSLQHPNNASAFKHLSFLFEQFTA